MSAQLLCLIVALVCFVVAAFGIGGGGRINLVAAGLAFLTVAKLVG